MKKVLGKGLYCYKSNPNEKYTKIFLENHEVDMDGTIGIDLGRIPEFDGMPKETNYCGKTMKLVKHEFQIELERFGKTEGDCEFWDYESDDKSLTVSVAVLSDGKRADVVIRE